LYGVKTGGRGAGFKVKEMEKRSNGRERHARTWIMETGGKGKEWRRVEEEVERRGDGRTGERENGRAGDGWGDVQATVTRDQFIATHHRHGGRRLDSDDRREERRAGRKKGEVSECMGWI
jgi:hypothetical protein